MKGALIYFLIFFYERKHLRSKSYDFAIRIINLYKYISKEKNEYILSKQILRSGTSIGAQIRGATYAQSKSDFIHKLSISIKEANETAYWLNLLRDTDYIEADVQIYFK